MRDELRYLLAIQLITWAFKVLPYGDEKREMATFITQSWLSKVGGQRVSTNHPTHSELDELRRMWQAKVGKNV